MTHLTARLRRHAAAPAILVAALAAWGAMTGGAIAAPAAPGGAAGGEPAAGDTVTRHKPIITSLRLRIGAKGQIFLYPPTAPMPEGARAVVFFSGDWGWKPVQQDTASWLASHGRYVVGIDSTEYFGRKLEAVDWVRDLKTLRAFANEKAGLPPDTPILLAGFTWGAELVPYMLARGGAEGIAGALLIGPDDDSACVYRVTLQMKAASIPSPPDERFRTSEEIRRMPPIPLVFMEGETDTESGARALSEAARGPKKYVSVPGGDRQFRDVRGAYYSLVGQALDWLETAQ